MPLLVVEKGHDKGKAIPIHDGKTILIGRDSSTNLPLRDTMTSRMHFKVESRDDEFWLHDLESMNGTYLNGARVRGEPVKLHFGDLIKAGETFFTFQSDDVSATTLAGQRIGGYRIIERLGRGGMGTVYKAEQIDLQRMVALKVISEEHTKDQEFVDLFVHEARAAAKLNHPNIVQVYDVKRHSELHYFSMEYVSGGSVQDILGKQRKLPVEQTVQMIADAARGLEYAHKKGIVHRDIKPDNLMISETGSVKIGDMGLARGLNEKVGPEEETSVIGTPHYIAPEQVLGRPADFRCDIYSLGATMYRMLAGTTPFSAPSVRDLVNRKVREDASLVTEHTPEVPKGLAQILALMMARDPDRRYQTMAEVVGALEAFQRGQTGTGEIRREHSTALHTFVQDRRLLAGTVAALLLLLVGGAWALSALFRDKPGDHAIKESTPNLELADQMLENAKLLDRRLKDRVDSKALEKVLEEYDSVLAKYPGTAVATKATELREGIRKELRDLRSVQKLQLAEAEEKRSFQKLSQSFQAHQPDLAPAEEAVAVYQKLAEETRGTVVAAQASARAAHIQKWRGLAEQQRAEFKKILGEVHEARDQKHFREGQAILAAFLDRVRRAAPECDFAKDRWHDLLFDDLAEAEMKVLAAEAQTAWVRLEGEARALARDKNYEAAIKILEDVIADYVDDVVKIVRPLKEAWQSEWDAAVRREREMAEAAAAEALAQARATFAEASAAAHKLFAKDFDFKGALLKIRALRDGNKVDELKPGLDRRVAELERAAHFKETLIGVIKARDAAGASPFKFRRDYVLDTLEVAIDDADDKSITFVLKNGEGKFQRSWSQFDGPGFVTFVRKQWKYNPQQNADPGERCDLAAVCLEFGLYEDAAQEIRDAVEGIKASAVPVSEAVKKFCEEYGPRIARGESAVYWEVEAQKRMDRLDAFMRNAAYAEARNEIDILRGRYYGRSQTVLRAASKIDDYLQEIAKKGGEQLNKSRREEKLQRLLDRVAEEEGAAKKAQEDIVRRLNRIDDLFQRNAHLGAALASTADLRSSTDRYQDAKRAGEGMLARKEAGREFWPSLGVVYGELIRLAVLSKDRARAQAVRNEGTARFVDPDQKVEEKWWADQRTALDAWSERILPQEEKRLPVLRDELRVNPDDPQRIWTLAVCLMDSMGNLFEARGYFMFLLENHREFSQVSNGNCLYRLAEIHFASREIPQAIKRYGELKDQNKDHPKVLDTASATGVKRRLDDCYKLLNRMGYAREKPK
jgi:serine/threonine protein kinase/tetratricopeptide (TPR) repeat protein